MESLSLWPDVDSDLLSLPPPHCEPLEIDRLSPSLSLTSSSSSALHLGSSQLLFDDLYSLDCSPSSLALPASTAHLSLTEHGGAQSPLLCHQPQLQHQQQQQTHSHDGLSVCEFSTATCPMNPYGHDPIIGEPLLHATPGTVAALRSAVARGADVTPSRTAGRRQPPTLPPPPPYPGASRQFSPQRRYYDELLPSGGGAGRSATGAAAGGSPLRSVQQPRLKVARRLTSSGGGGRSLLSMHRHNIQQQQHATNGVLSPGYATSAQLRSPAGGGAMVTAAGGDAECRHTKPSLSYVNLITLALLNSPSGSLRCNEIYDFLQRVFPYFREVSSKTWKNDTRHALSSNQSSSNFCKAPETKAAAAGGNRGALWMAKPEKMEFLHEHLTKTYYKFADNIREAMQSAELYDELLMVVRQGCSGSTFLVLDVVSPCAQSPTVGSTTDSPDGL